MKKEFVRNPYNYDSDDLSEETGLLCKDESLTEQEHAQEADINYIADRFMRTGELPQVLNLPTPGDFEGIFDFQSAMNLVKQAKDEFMQLPAKVRTRFDNDPQKLLQFMGDENNRAEAEFLGIVPKKEPVNETGTERPATTATQGKARTPGTPSNTQSTTGTKGPGPETDQDA